jgi:hypothetical protein
LPPPMPEVNPKPITTLSSLTDQSEAAPTLSDSQ